MIIERIDLSLENGELKGNTWDSNGQFIEMPLPDLLTADEQALLHKIFEKRRTLTPQWDQEKIRLEEDKAKLAKEKAESDQARQEALDLILMLTSNPDSIPPDMLDPGTQP